MTAPAEPAPRSRLARLVHLGRSLRFEVRLLLLALGAALPATAVALAVVWMRLSRPLAVAASLVLLAIGLGLPALLFRRLEYSLNTLSNLLEALREGDFSLRAHAERGEGPMQEVLREVNALGGILREQRLGAVEATILLRRVMDAIDVAVFAFDRGGKLQVVNRAGARLLARRQTELLERSAEELGLADLLEGEPNQLVDRAFPGRVARWDVRRSGFRKDGFPVRLVVLSDLSRPLREEERQAWRRLIRVLGHELNNSLAPIKSTAETLANLLDREPRPDDWEDDARAGLRMISSRSEALARFMAAYARLARLPPPSIREVRIEPLVRRVAALERRVPIEVEEGTELVVPADPDQLEQALINLVQNGAEAVLETSGTGVRIGWRELDGVVEIRVEDDGPGLSNPENLFVPFYTTKPSGTGIGLVLARQIAEAHGGTVTLEERREGPGVLARLRLAGSARRAAV